MTEERNKRKYPEVVEVKAKGKVGSGKTKILDDVTDLLQEHGYVPVKRDDATDEITHIYQHEPEKDKEIANGD